MNKSIEIWNFIKPKIRYFFLLYTAFLIYSKYKNNPIHLTFLILLDSFLIVYTFIEINKNYIRNSEDEYKNSFFIISILIYSLMWIFSTCDNIYYFILLDDLFHIKNNKRRNIFLIFHALIFIFIICLKTIQFKNFSNNIYTVAFSILIYGLIIITFFLIHKLRWDRDKLKILNSNLIEYSFKEREFLISSERNRISQELHDSIGHSLMALSMNVRYLKALKDKQQIDEEIDNIDILVKESIDILRNTVYNLRKLDENLNFQQQVRGIIKKFNELNILKINFFCNKSIECVSRHVKDVLITTIKEGITNGIKHGDPSVINISIKLETLNDGNKIINLIISNNGQGCKNIIKSNGLNGITERVKDINGTVEFKSPKNKGFIIEVSIKWGEHFK
ncbi:MAG: sensor histidine kinase [Clostridium sp.]|nr:sensor histidine kinase [Clostridium sp.]